MERVTDFIFLGSNITADGDWSHEIKRHLLLGRKAMTNLDNVLKSRGRTNFKTISHVSRFFLERKRDRHIHTHITKKT